jgi:O-antigen/teichoic acid export membrane protein
MPVRRTIRAVKSDLAAAKVKGSFARSALFTFGEGLVNILAQVILSPLVAKIYGPAAYGVYGLFSSITSNLAGIAGLGYTPAILLPKEDERAIALLRLNFLLTALLVLLSLPFFLFPSILYRIAPNWAVMGNWCMLVPVMTLVLAVNQALIAWAMRAKAFSFSAQNNSVTIIGIRAANLGIGLLTKGATWGLIVGDTFMRGLSSLAYMIGLRKHGLGRVLHDNGVELRRIAAEYREYPRYVFPARYLNLFALQLPIFGLTTLGDSAVVGYFTLAGSILLMPLRLFGYSLSSVFFRKAAEIGTSDPVRLSELVRRMYTRLCYLGVVPFTALIFFGDIAFDLVLGKEWAMAGAYCGIMGPFYLFRLLSEPIASVYNTRRDERALFRFNLYLFTANAAAVLVGVYVFHGAVATALLFSAVNAVAYLLQSVAILRMSSLPAWSMTARTVAMAILAAAVLMALRKLIDGTWWPALW